MEYVHTLPKDLGPRAVGLSNESVKERQIEQSIEVRVISKQLKSNF